MFSFPAPPYTSGVLLEVIPQKTWEKKWHILNMSAGMDNQMHTLMASDSPSYTVSGLWGALPYLSHSLLYPPHLRYLGPNSMEIAHTGQMTG